MTHLVASFTVFEIVGGVLALAIILEQRRRILAAALSFLRELDAFIVASIAHRPAAAAPLSLSASGRVLPSRRPYDGSLDTSEVRKVMSAPASFNLPVVLGTLGDFLKMEVEASKDTILADIQSGETTVDSLIAGYVKKLPQAGGLLGVVESQFEAAVDKWAAAVVAKYGPEVIFDFADLELGYLVKDLGG